MGDELESGMVKGEKSLVLRKRWAWLCTDHHFAAL